MAHACSPRITAAELAEAYRNWACLPVIAYGVVRTLAAGAGIGGVLDDVAPVRRARRGVLLTAIPEAGAILAGQRLGEGDGVGRAVGAVAHAVGGPDREHPRGVDGALVGGRPDARVVAVAAIEIRIGIGGAEDRS